jgi:two-component sensor histidine kinase
MEEYLRRIVQALESLYGSPGVQISLAVTDVTLESQRATLVGLIVTELVTNALQHGFPPGARGRIEVELRPAGDQYELRVTDSGVGMASLMPTVPSALGLRLVRLYVQRLHGRIDLEVSGGTRFAITFPVRNTRGDGRGVGS